jgi:hypothetical protein
VFLVESAKENTFFNYRPHVKYEMMDYHSFACYYRDFTVTSYILYFQLQISFLFIKNYHPKYMVAYVCMYLVS